MRNQILILGFKGLKTFSDIFSDRLKILHNILIIFAPYQKARLD